MHRIEMQGGALVRRCGYIDHTGALVIESKFDRCSRFREDRAIVEDASGTAVISSAGQILFRVPVEREMITGYRDGLAWFVEGASMQHHQISGGKWGCYDRFGNVAIPPRFDGDYDHIPGTFYEGRAAVWSDGKWGFIDRSGQFVIPPTYDAAFPFSEGLAVVGVGDIRNRKYGFIDPRGVVIIPVQYPMANSFKDGVAVVQPPDAGLGTLGFVDRSGRPSLGYTPAFSDGPGFSEGRCAVRAYAKEPMPDGSKCVVCAYDVSGKRPGDPCPECGGPIGEEKIGFVDPNGKMIIPPTLPSDSIVRPFSEGLAAVGIQTGDKTCWGFIDHTGKTVIPSIFSEVEPFQNGLAKVTLEENGTEGSVDRAGYIDQAGRFVWKEPPVRLNDSKPGAN